MIDQIIKELTFKHGLDKDVMEAIVMAPYVFLRDIIASGDMESVRMPKLGLFIVKPHRKIKYESDLLKQDEREITERKRDSTGVV